MRLFKTLDRRLVKKKVNKKLHIRGEIPKFEQLQFFDVCSSLILMTENEKFLNETNVSL